MSKLVSYVTSKKEVFQIVLIINTLTFPYRKVTRLLVYLSPGYNCALTIHAEYKLAVLPVIVILVVSDDRLKIGFDNSIRGVSTIRWLLYRYREKPEQCVMWGRVRNQYKRLK